MFFAPLAPMPQDPILSLTEQFRADPDPHKLDLGVGVYTDEAGNTPVLPSVLEGERRVLAHQQTKKYVGIAGDRGFCDLHQVLTFGAEHPARRDGRIVTIQTPGGSGGLRVAAELIGRARAGATVWVSDPTWSNHMPLLGSAGLALRSYPYFDMTRQRLEFDRMLETLAEADRGDVVLLHGCCHNPTGEDLDASAWEAVTDLLIERDLLPFVDLAYQGFGAGVEADVAGLRLLAERVPELVLVNSCSKNFSLYRERAGSLSVVCAGRREAEVVASNLSAVARSMYSMPPHHGAGIVAEVLGDPALNEQWHAEVQAVCERIQHLRSTLADALQQRMPSRDFSFLSRQRGMFSLLGIPGEAIERLRTDFHVYVVGSSRVNIAGLASRTINRFADALTAVLDS